MYVRFLSLSNYCCSSHLHFFAVLHFGFIPLLLVSLALLSHLLLSRLSTGLSMCHFLPIGCTHLSAWFCNTLHTYAALLLWSLHFTGSWHIHESPNGDSSLPFVITAWAVSSFGRLGSFHLALPKGTVYESLCVCVSVSFCLSVCVCLVHWLTNEINFICAFYLCASLKL